MDALGTRHDAPRICHALPIRDVIFHSEHPCYSTAARSNYEPPSYAPIAFPLAAINGRR